MRFTLAAVLVTASALAACARTQQEAPVATATPIAAAPGAPAAAPTPRRQPVSPMRQDTVRQQAIATLLATLQGRENEPAGTVFKNVKLHKQMPVREFLTMMDEQYGRGLGFTCTNCHVDNNYASDERKNKVIARQMERMQRDIDAKYIDKVKELDADKPKTTCVMCHRGTAHMPNTMDVPTAPVPSRKR